MNSLSISLCTPPDAISGRWSDQPVTALYAHLHGFRQDLSQGDAGRMFSSSVRLVPLAAKFLLRHIRHKNHKRPPPLRDHLSYSRSFASIRGSHSFSGSSWSPVKIWRPLFEAPIGVNRWFIIAKPSIRIGSRRPNPSRSSPGAPPQIGHSAPYEATRQGIAPVGFRVLHYAAQSPMNPAVWNHAHFSGWHMFCF